MTSNGYPNDYKKGMEIKGLKDAEDMNGVFIFHSGTEFKDGRVVTNGGRVLGITALEKTIPDTIDLAYQAVEKIDWESLYYRKDIGKKALKYL
jgi:phosphoribosylamine--glycine ligase